MKKQHDFSTRQEKASLKCPLCRSKRATYKELNSHLSNEHDMDITYDKLNFASKESFEQWKADIETKTKSFFKCRKTKGSFVQYDCHRSGHYVSKAKSPVRQREIKVKGTNKIGACCPARIELQKKDGCEMEVLFVNAHVGHKQEVGRLWLTKLEKEEIAGKLLRGKRRHMENVLNSYSSLYKIGISRYLMS